MRIGVIAAVALASLLLAGCQPRGDEFGRVPPERKATWEKAFNAGDAATAAGLYAEDAKLVMSGAEPIVGRAAILAALQEHLASGAKIELETLQSVASGGVGYNYGEYVVRGPDARMLDRGHFAEVWERRNGEWYITVDANVSNAPRPAAPAGASGASPGAAAADPTG